MLTKNMGFKNFTQKLSGFATKAGAFISQKVPDFVRKVSHGASIFQKHLDTGRRLLEHANTGVQSNSYIGENQKQFAQKYHTQASKGLGKANDAAAGLQQFSEHLNKFS